MQRKMLPIQLLHPVLMALLFLMTSARSATCQAGAGLPDFAPLEQNLDHINDSDLNVHFDFPLFSKPQRGGEFGFSLSYDGTFGFNGVEIFSLWHLKGPNLSIGNGNVTYQVGSYVCPNDPSNWEEDTWPSSYYQVYSNYVYADDRNTPHEFSGLSTSDYQGCGYGVETASARSDDGSILITATGPSFQTTDVGGLTGTSIDTNGNQPYSSWSSYVTDPDGKGNTSTIIDNTGATLYEHARITDVGYTVPNYYTTYTYIDTNGLNQSVVLHYAQYQQRVYFTPVYSICWIVNGECYPRGYNTMTLMPSSIEYPDGTSYVFTYETVPNHPGYVTGRLASVKLRSGGLISYGYFGGSGNYGILDDFISGNAGATTLGLTRTTVDGTTTYTRTQTANYQNEDAITVITDPQMNDTVVESTILGNSHYAVARREVFSGPQSTGVSLQKTTYCYNGAAGFCPTMQPSGTTSAINQVDTSTCLDSSHCFNTTQKFNSYSLASELDEYDFGSASPTRKTTTTYATLGNNILNRPYQVTVYDSVGSIVKQATYEYDGASLSTVNGLPSGSHLPVSGARGNLTKSTELVAGNTTVQTLFSYFDSGALRTVQDPGGHVTTTQYDSGGLFPSSITSPTTSTSISTYNAPVSHVEWFQYDINTGKLLKHVPQSGSGINDTAHATTYLYDSVGRPREVDGPNGSQTTVAYAGVPGAYTSTVTVSAAPDPNRISITQYDELGRTMRSKTSAGNGSGSQWEVTDRCYDNNGHQSFVTYPYMGSGSASRVCPGSTGTLLPGDLYSFDALGRTTGVTHADGSASSTAFSGIDKLIIGEGHLNSSGVMIHAQSVQELDGFGRLRKVCEIATNPQAGQNVTGCNASGFPSLTGFTTSYDYDVQGNLVAVHQLGLADRSFTYDALAHLTDSSNPESGAIHYVYDADGLLIQKTAARANLTLSDPFHTTATTYAYDQLHRLYMTSYDDGITATQMSVYDAYPYWGPPNGVGERAATLSKLPGASSNYNESVFGQYDESGRLKLRLTCVLTGCNSSYLVQGFSYDAAGNMVHMDSGAGTSVDWHYNAQGSVDSVTGNNFGSPQTAIMSGASFVPGGLSTATLGNGLQIQNSYDPRNRPVSLNLLSSGAAVYSAAPTYAPDGNVQTALDTAAGGSWTYAYDEFNRLQQAVLGTATITWTYDRYGNRLSQTATGAGGFSLAQGTFSPPSGDNRSQGYCHDRVGNVLDKGACPATGNPHELKYDAEGRLLSSEYGATSYLYDAQGGRVEKLPSGSPALERFYDLSGNPIWIQTPTGWHFNVFVGTTLLSTYYTETSQLYYVSSNWLGTTRHESNSAGSTQKDCFSLPFGDSLNCSGSGTDATVLDFTGKERDPESGLHYFGARYYESTIGRFISPDPSSTLAQKPENPQSWNLYSYVNNSPLSSVDPSGLDCLNVVGREDDKITVLITHGIGAAACGEQHGTYVPGNVNKEDLAFNGDTNLFQVASNDGQNIYYTNFNQSARTEPDGYCLSGCGGYGSAHADVSWLKNMLHGGNLDDMMSFMVGRVEPLHGGGMMKMLSGPGLSFNAPDNWAGPGGMGLPQGQGDWAAMIHDYNFLKNHVTIGSYWNPFISRQTAKALIQSNNTLIGNAGGVQAVKMGMFFGILINPVQWITHPYF